MKTVENLGTSLLLMLQLLPAQQLAAARGAASAAASGAASPAAAGRAAAVAAESPAELLELQMALLELLPTLCKAAAQAVSQQQGAAAAAGGMPAAASAGGSVADRETRESYVAVLLELLKEILRHQLQPDAWREPVLRHLDLVAMMQSAAARVNSSGAAAHAGAAAGSAADSGSSSGAAAAGVTDISVLEVLQVCEESVANSTASAVMFAWVRKFAWATTTEQLPAL